VRLVGGRYRVDEVIGTGAMGTVWSGYDTRLHRPVAIKEVHLTATATEDQRALLTRRAMAEARHAARVSHPNIVAVHDVVADRGMPCLVMRLVEGHSLAQQVRSEGPVSPAEAATIGISLVDALTAAHRAGVVHRDVKPSNVLITDDEVLLTDFSIATDSARNTLSAGGGALGSPGYIAPERLNGEPTGAAADLFGLGATLFCAVEGRGPFDRADPLASLLATATYPHPMPKRAGPLAPLLDSLLSKHPDERPNLTEIRSALLAVARDPGADVPSEPTTDPDVPRHPMDRPPPAHVAPGSRRRTSLLVAAAVIVACAAATLVTAAVRSSGGHRNGNAAVAAAALPTSAPTTGTPSPLGTSLPSATPAHRPSSPPPSLSASAAASPRSKASSEPTTPAGQTTSATLSVSPASYLGPCSGDVALTVQLSVVVSAADIPVRYRLMLAPGNGEIASGAGTAGDDATFANSDKVSVSFAGGSGTYAVQAAIEAPSPYTPVPATIHVVCIG
jgi:serine/threonine protein kinase